MPKAIIVHGIEGSTTEHKWFSWLKNELQKHEFDVWCENMTNSSNSNFKIWTKIVLDKIESDTILIGHSLDVATILTIQ